uniref:Uncharacterized protein n=1 Tax=Anguilla anguilla TaxID=7936 RepID=A0A0E9V5Y2_ANGAN
MYTTIQQSLYIQPSTSSKFCILTE